ncbi:MAG TPA: T9SS type A sorting domain-containing protein, partial [Chitinophagaceae bacterium]|nr:T9SS type A sorting domain-containing protein [Chitinophagaceae bacterium]
ITAMDGNACEVALYTACNGGNVLETNSSMCLDDGTGLWAPAHNFSLQASKTYYLRIKTSGTTTIQLAGQNYVPQNEKCSGATSVSTSSLPDNNACHHGSTEVLPAQLSAFSLENTAFYQYYAANTGNTIINISSISCDNGNVNNSNGFQIGFFTGSCGTLIPLYSTSGSGSFVQATTPVLLAGTKVFVAIDGTSGSNCQYSISGINILGVLAEGFKDFSGWKTASSNILRWTTLHDMAVYYEIERSANGRDFSPIGRVNRINGSSDKTNYSFEDQRPVPYAYYRIKQISNNGNAALSEVVLLKRENETGFGLHIQNPVTNNLQGWIETTTAVKLTVAVIDMWGRLYIKDEIHCNAGITQVYKNLSHLPAGKYILKIAGESGQLNKSLIKLN